MSTIKGTPKHNKGRVLGVLRVRKKKTKKQNKKKEPRMRTSTEIKGNDKIHCIVNMEKNLVAQGTSISGSLD